MSHPLSPRELEALQEFIAAHAEIVRLVEDAVAGEASSVPRESGKGQHLRP
jgi:hypothetical protein